MKIVCPACEASYEVPDAVVTSRRKMRCARCSTDWVPADALAQGDAAAEAPVAIEPAVPPPQPTVAEPVEAVPAIRTATPPDDAPIIQAAETSPAVPTTSRPASDEPVAKRREEEPYQLALRPETHVSVFPPAQPAAAIPPVFRDANPRVIQAPAEGPPVLAWSASILLLVAMLATVIVFRGPVMKSWPPSTRLYVALRLAQP